MRIEHNPDHAPDFLAVHVATEEIDGLADGWVQSNVAFDEESAFGINLMPLSQFPGKDVTERKAIRSEGRPRADYDAADGQEELCIYIPDEWIPMKNFTRVPIPVTASDKPKDLPSKGVMLIFEREETEST